MALDQEKERRAWALRLFNKSPLKSRKFRKIVSYLGATEGLTGLDIGADNGVISMLLRERGGLWYSCDLIPETVASIRSLVGERVEQIDGEHTPYSDNQFDAAVIVDFLEHIPHDRRFIEELHRIVKPGGRLVVSVPNPKEGWLRRLRCRIGQTDEAHGHLRPGYTPAALAELLSGCFEIECSESYSRIFSELTDTIITLALDVLKKKGRGRKGTVLTPQELARLQKSFRLYSLIYPIVKLLAMVDDLCPGLHGNMVIARARSLKV